MTAEDMATRFQRQAKLEAEFTGHISKHITSVDSFARTSEVSPKVAAVRIAAGDHRLSTEAEIQEWHADQERRRAAILAVERVRQPGLIEPGIFEVAAAAANKKEGK